MASIAEKGATMKRKLQNSDPKQTSSIKRQKKVVEDDLPSQTLTPAHKEWLDPHKDEFKSAWANKGSRDGAKKWVRVTLTDDFINTFFPNLSSDQKRRFFEPITTVSLKDYASIIIGVIHNAVIQKIYSYFHNGMNRVTMSRTQLRSTNRETRVNPENLGYQDNKDLVQTKVAEHPDYKGNGLSANIGILRKVYCALFHELPESERQKYERLAEEKRGVTEQRGKQEPVDKKA
jgi:hypothetical protein